MELHVRENSKMRSLLPKVAASLLIAHGVAVTCASFPAMSDNGVLVLHMISGLCYLFAYLTFGSYFHRHAPVISKIFMALVTLGIGSVFFSLFRQATNTASPASVWWTFIEELSLPAAMVLFAVILLLKSGYPRTIGLLYLIGSLGWLIGAAFSDDTMVFINFAFVSELIGMFATLALIVWTFFVGAERKHLGRANPMSEQQPEFVR